MHPAYLIGTGWNDGDVGAAVAIEEYSEVGRINVVTNVCVEVSVLAIRVGYGDARACEARLEVTEVLLVHVEVLVEVGSDGTDRQVDCDGLRTVVGISGRDGDVGCMWATARPSTPS